MCPCEYIHLPCMGEAPVSGKWAIWLCPMWTNQNAPWLAECEKKRIPSSWDYVERKGRLRTGRKHGRGNLSFLIELGLSKVIFTDQYQAGEMENLLAENANVKLGLCWQECLYCRIICVEVHIEWQALINVLGLGKRTIWFLSGSVFVSYEFDEIKLEVCWIMPFFPWM